MTLKRTLPGTRFDGTFSGVWDIYKGWFNDPSVPWPWKEHSLGPGLTWLSQEFGVCPGVVLWPCSLTFLLYTMTLKRTLTGTRLISLNLLVTENSYLPPLSHEFWVFPGVNLWPCNLTLLLCTMTLKETLPGPRLISLLVSGGGWGKDWNRPRYRHSPTLPCRSWALFNYVDS